MGNSPLILKILFGNKRLLNTVVKVISHPIPEKNALCMQVNVGMGQPYRGMLTGDSWSMKNCTCLVECVQFEKDV